MSFEYLPLIVILALSLFAHNQSVALAAAILIIIKLLGCDEWFPILENKGMTIGITIITLAILAPVAAGKIPVKEMYDSLLSPVGFLAVLTGVFVAWMAGKGVIFFKATPDAIISLILGTIIGITFFQGIAVGPLIAAGMLSLLVSLYNKFGGS